MTTYSFSRMQLFDHCRMQYLARYGTGPNRAGRIPFVSSFALESGQMAHRVIENYLNLLQHHQEESAPHFIPELVETVYKDPKGPSTATFDDVLHVCTKFAKRYRHDYRTFLGTEMFLSRTLVDDPDPDKRIDIIGYPDRVSLDSEGETVVACDNKTGWKAEVTDANEFQGKVYDWLLEPAFPGLKAAYEIDFVRFDNAISQRYTLMPWDYERLEARMRAIIARIEDAHRSGNFPPTAGPHCQFCGVASKCAARNDLVQAGLVVDDSQSAVGALQDRFILEAAFKQRDNQLREYAKIHGPVEMNGAVAQFAEKQTAAIESPKDLIDTLGLEEALPLLAINGNKTKTKKVQNDPRLADLWRTRNKTEWDVGATGRKEVK